MNIIFLLIIVFVALIFPFVTHCAINKISENADLNSKTLEERSALEKSPCLDVIYEPLCTESTIPGKIINFVVNSSCQVKYAERKATEKLAFEEEAEKLRNLKEGFYISTSLENRVQCMPVKISAKSIVLVKPERIIEFNWNTQYLVTAISPFKASRIYTEDNERGLVLNISKDLEESDPYKTTSSEYGLLCSSSDLRIMLKNAKKNNGSQIEGGRAQKYILYLPDVNLNLDYLGYEQAECDKVDVANIAVGICNSKIEKLNAVDNVIQQVKHVLDCSVSMKIDVVIIPVIDKWIPYFDSKSVISSLHKMVEESPFKKSFKRIVFCTESPNYFLNKKLNNRFHLFNNASPYSVINEFAINRLNSINYDKFNSIMSDNSLKYRSTFSDTNLKYQLHTLLLWYIELADIVGIERIATTYPQFKKSFSKILYIFQIGFWTLSEERTEVLINEVIKSEIWNDHVQNTEKAIKKENFLLKSNKAARIAAEKRVAEDLAKLKLEKLFLDFQVRGSTPITKEKVNQWCLDFILNYTIKITSLKLKIETLTTLLNNSGGKKICVQNIIMKLIQEQEQLSEFELMINLVERKGLDYFKLRQK